MGKKKDKKEEEGGETLSSPAPTEAATISWSGLPEE